jgi:hypothetical protein
MLLLVTAVIIEKNKQERKLEFDLERNKNRVCQKLYSCTLAPLLPFSCPPPFFSLLSSGTIKNDNKTQRPSRRKTRRKLY